MAAEDWLALELAEGAGLADLRVIETDVRLPDGPVLLGLGVDGHRHLLVPQPPSEPIHEDLNSQGVRIEQRDLLDRGRLRRFGDVHCLVPHLNELFGTVAAELLVAVARLPDDPIPACSRVLDRWRELFRPTSRRRLGDQQLAGLLAELLVLRDVLEHDPARRLDVWTGPERARHDLRRQDRAVEVKATLAREGLLVEIHGAEQLDPPPDGALWLAVVRLESAPGGGLTVPDLVRDLTDLGVTRQDLLLRLAQVGYLAEDEESYADVRYEVKERRLYAVGPGFPRIVPGTFVNGSTPAGVMRLTYIVDLTNQPPVPLDDEATVAVYRELAQVP
jgi:Putative  PD-(D/E)XK family member, (DUF4420)